MSRAHDLPLIARIAGLPTEVIEPFETNLDRQLEALWREEELLAGARAALIDRLYATIPRVPRSTRRMLLAIKRDCHNGRSLPAGPDTYRLLLDFAEPETRRVAMLERSRDEASCRYAEAFHSAAHQQLQHLTRLVEDPLFRCGLSVASPDLGRAAQDSSADFDRSDARRQQRIATSVLRYASRAALKLSPMTTFTHVGLAQLKSGGGGPMFTSDWSPRSLVRARRHLINRSFDLLTSYRPLRRRLHVALNRSGSRLDDGRTLFLRSSRFRVHDNRTLAFEDEAIVKVRTDGRVVRIIDRLLAGGPIPYDHLTTHLARGLPDGPNEDNLGRFVDRLIEIGYLNLLPPWHIDEPRAETALLDMLRRLEREPELDALTADLEMLVRLQDGLLQAAAPADDIQRMYRLLGNILRRATRLGGHAEDVDVQRRSLDREIYQDIWCAPDAPCEAPVDAIIHVGRDSLEAATRSVTPLLRHARLFDRHHDFLATLGAWLRNSAHSRVELPVLEVFHRAQPLWQDFVRFRQAAKSAIDGWRQSWNPLKLAAIDEMVLWREYVADGIADCLSDGPDARRISVSRLDALLDRVPPNLTEGYLESCLFLQPADAYGSLWVLNRLKEGTGRFASRYTTLMDPPLRRRYGAAFASRGTLEVDGEMVRLLDVQCVRGDTLNVHAPQTPTVLLLPGDTIDLPPECRRTLDELVISVDEDGYPTIRDSDGVRFMPVYLGGAYIDYMPPLLRFLCAFGPTETAAVFPPPRMHARDGATVRERTVIGNVVLHRRMWVFPAAELRRLFTGSNAAECFAEVRRWRQQRDLPDRLFVLERVVHHIAGEVTKSQYIDLSSPLFVAALQAIVEGAENVVAFVEMLPSMDAFPRDPQGRRRAIELLVESLALTPPRSSISASGGESVRAESSV